MFYFLAYKWEFIYALTVPNSFTLLLNKYSTILLCRMGKLMEAIWKVVHSKLPRLLPTPQIHEAPQIQRTLHQVTNCLPMEK